MSYIYYRAYTLFNRLLDWWTSGQQGWVVVGYDEEGVVDPYHALALGTKFGMDYNTGRFPNRRMAQLYADYRNSPEGDYFAHGYYFRAVHETRTSCRLLGDNIPHHLATGD